MIHVKHRGLGAFEQHGLALVESLVQNQAGVGDVRLEAFAELEQLVSGLVHVDGATVVQLDQNLVLLVQTGFDLVMQVLGVEQVVHADADAVDLVGVGRADTAAGGADLMLAEETLGHLVERAMVRRDDMCSLTHQQAGAVHAAAFKTVNLLEQHFRIHDDAVADHGGDVRADDAGRQQVQRIHLVADHHAVAGIVAAVETGHIVHFGTDQIGSLAFAFVAPLSADQHDSGHTAPPHPHDSAGNSLPYALYCEGKRWGGCGYRRIRFSNAHINMGANGCNLPSLPC